jgi:hypothetical protein
MERGEDCSEVLDHLHYVRAFCPDDFEVEVGIREEVRGQRSEDRGQRSEVRGKSRKITFESVSLYWQPYDER